MIQILLFCVAIGTAVYGVMSDNILSLLTATMATLLAAGTLFGHPTRQERVQQALTKGIEQHGWLIFSVLALGPTGLATQQTLRNEFDRVSGYLWLCGLCMVVLAGYGHDYYGKKHWINPETKATETTQAVVTLDLLDWLLVLAITAVALTLRLYRLNDFLPAMHGDEGEMGMLALLARHGPASGISPTVLPLFSTAFLDHPTLFHYVQAAAMLLFGESLSGLRTLSVIFGALCVPVVYAIGRLGWGRVAGITAAWLLAVSHLHLQYSRIALNNIETVWFTALFMLLIILASQKTRWVMEEDGDGGDGMERAKRKQLMAPIVPYLWAGLTMGLSQYFYYGSRLIPVLAAPLLLFLLLKRRLIWPQMLMLIIATLVAYMPLAGHYTKSLSAFWNRTEGVSILSPEGMAHTIGPQATWPHDIPLLIWEQITRNIAFFVQDGDRSSFYLADLGAFDPITIMLFWLGLGLVLARIYRFQEFAILTWFGLGFLLAGVITNNAPNGPRLIVITTSIYIISGILLQYSFHFLQRIWPTGSRWGSLALGTALAFGTFQLNFTTYFDIYANYSPNMLTTSMAHDIVDLGAKDKVYLFGTPRLYADYGVLRFIAFGTERYNAEQAEQLPTIEEVQAEDQGLMVIVLPHRLADLDRVIERFPGGIRDERLDRVGNLLYVIYRVPHRMALES